MNATRRLVAALKRPFARRLELRIVALFLGLLLVVQLAGFVAIRHGIEANARAQIESELRTGEKLLRRLLAVNAQSLAQASKVLAADFGFRSALASGDRLTLADVLDNHGARVGAEAALFTDAQQRLVASTLPDARPVLDIVRAGLGSDRAPDTVCMLDGQPFQLVTVAVRAPQLIGHVSMGFPVSAALLREVEQISGLKTGLVARAHGGGWSVLPIGTWSIALRDLRPPLGDGVTAQAVRLGGESHAALVVGLARDGAQEVGAVLLQSVDKAVAPYRRLQLTLLGITVLGIAVSALGSVVTARNITRPIKALSASAERLGAGDYDTPISVATRDEVRELAQSFEAMRVGMRERDSQIRRLAYWDDLTGLPNRAQLRDLLAERLARARAAGEPCAVVMLDLDRFKRVNDVLGRAFGDRLLAQIAQRLTDGGMLRDDDVVARLGGDEFAALLPRADADTALAVAARLRRALEQPTLLDDQAVDVSAGVGVAVFPQHGADADALLGRAELAMHAAKSGQAGVCLYAPGLDSSSRESLSLLTELRHAVEGDQLRLYLQPKIDLASGRALGAEALVRWQHPQRGLVPPMEFIPFAEQTGFIRVLTGWVIDRCAARCRALGGESPGLKFAINLSTRDLLDQDLPAKLERQFARGGVNPQSLCLEITESAIMDDPQRALQTLKRLHDMGLRLSIDDFGTGYSSLAYLKQLPLHELKIDKSFVMKMDSDRADLKIVRSTIDLAHNLGLAVVAEGVENAQTWALLKALKCDEAQGYFMSRPMPEDDFDHWLHAWAQPEAKLRTDFAAFV